MRTKNANTVVRLNVSAMQTPRTYTLLNRSRLRSCRVWFMARFSPLSDLIFVANYIYVSPAFNEILCQFINCLRPADSAAYLFHRNGAARQLLCSAGVSSGSAGKIAGKKYYPNASGSIENGARYTQYSMLYLAYNKSKLHVSNAKKIKKSIIFYLLKMNSCMYQTTIRFFVKKNTVRLLNFLSFNE